MLKRVIKDKDQVIFLPAFGPAVVVVKPGKITAKGKTKIGSDKICIKGDEKSVKVAGCDYISPPFVIPGKGTLTIKQLAPNQLTKVAKSGGKPIIMKGVMFTAKFEVTKKAEFQAGPVKQMDPMPFYMGQGQFVPKAPKFNAK